MKTFKAQTNKTSAVITKRLRRLEQYQSSHRGDLKKAVIQGYYTPSVAGAMYYLSGTVTGDTYDDRTGLVINVQRYYLNINFKMTTTAAVRILIVIDKFNQGSTPSVTDILEVGDVTSPLNYSNTVAQKRFRIILDKTYNFSINGTLSAHELKDIALPLKIRYIGSSASSAFAGQNSMYLLMISDTPTAGSVGFNSRILFTDE
jgi:hypothetical protein